MTDAFEHDASNAPVVVPVAAVARLLGVSVPAVWNMLDHGTLHRVELAGVTKIAVAELEAVLGRKLTWQSFNPSHYPATPAPRALTDTASMQNEDEIHEPDAIA